MRIGIISDTHDQLERTERAVGQLRDAGAEVLVHCGDFVEPDIVRACAVLPLYFVFGNNDCDTVPYLRQAGAAVGATCLGWGGVFELEGKRIGVTHGHLTTDLKTVLQQAPDYLFTGHSHQRDDRREGTLRRINPGALHRAQSYSVAILNLATDELEFLDVAR